MCGKLSQTSKCIKNVKHKKTKLEANVDTKAMLIEFTLW